MAQAHVQGANAEGLLCTFKHFPGHGATTGDSHSSLPIVDIPLAELQAKHVAPYATLIGAGMGDLVMSAHVWYPCLDPGVTAWPATLSTPALTDILRTQLGFTGVAISDSYGMSGLRLAAADSDSPRIGVQAGLDIILMPPDVARRPRQPARRRQRRPDQHGAHRRLRAPHPDHEEPRRDARIHHRVARGQERR